MRRRALLRAVGAAGVAGTTALAGCTSLVMTASTAEIAEEGEVAERHGLGLDAEIVQSEYTDEHPARVRITLTNGDELQQISWCGFRGENRKSSPHGLWLFPTSRFDNLREKDRWVTPRGVGRLVGARSQYVFAPGGSIPTSRLRSISCSSTTPTRRGISPRGRTDGRSRTRS